MPESRDRVLASIWIDRENLQMQSPQEGTRQIGRFEWFGSEGEGGLVIQCLGGTGNTLTVAGWGMNPDEVSESEIEAVILYAQALAHVYRRNQAMAERVAAWLLSATFAELLNSLEDFVSTH